MAAKVDFLSKLAKKHYFSSSHNWNHILRVSNTAELIAKKENADLEIVLPAVVLHDLGRFSGKEENHALNVKLAKSLLEKAGYAKEEQEKILGCIKVHSVIGDKKPDSLEARVLFDADKIDSYGFIGIARFFALVGEQKLTLQEALEKAIEKISALERVSGFYTKTGREFGFKKAKRAFLFYYLLAKELGEESATKKLEKILKQKQGKIKAALFKKVANIL